MTDTADSFEEPSARRAWDDRVDAAILHAAERVPRSPFIVGREEPRPAHPTVIDWTGLPLRVTGCLPRADALALLDWTGASGCEARRRIQDEYLEWRVLRDSDDVVRRVESTCELPDAWRVLAAHAPAEALRLAAHFAGDSEIGSEALFGDLDPFACGIGPIEREAAFAAAMLDDPGPYNNGERALCCMIHPSNTLDAVVALLFAASFAFERDGGGVERSFAAREVIPLLSGAAQDGRASDPLVVERLGRLAFEGRRITLEHPHALAIIGVEHTRLRRPDGRSVPSAWFSLERPAGNGRFRRASLEVPAAEGFRVGDLVDAATGERIAGGAQVADLVQLGLALRVSEPREVPRQDPPRWLTDTHPEASDCETIRQALQDFIEETR